MADKGEILANFVAITSADDTAALPCLEATNWSLEEACSLFFASNDAQGGNSHGGGHAGPHGGLDDFPDIPPEEEVRAPLPTKVERLYGNQGTMDPRALAAASAAQYGLNRERHAPPVDVFRDFKAEGKEAEGKGKGAGNLGLSQLFKPPKDLLFQGDFDMAKMRASQEGKWLLLNIQAHNEFDSHRLNRDTWTLEALKEMIKGMFLFYQCDDSTSEGRRLTTTYKAVRLPSIMVLDPMTGAKVYNREGFVGAEKLIEDLVPFMDHGPTDPGAGQMTYAMGLKRKAQEEAALSSAQLNPQRHMTEDEQMAMALAMSMQGGTGSGPGEAGTSSLQQEASMEVDEAAVWEAIRRKEEEEQRRAAIKTPEQVRQEAAARLPAEPPESSPTSCRVAFRMPDGSRTQRRFAKTDTVQALVDYVITTSADAANGAEFDLLPPGSQALADLTQTLEQAGVANSVLAVKLK